MNKYEFYDNFIELYDGGYIYTCFDPKHPSCNLCPFVKNFGDTGSVCPSNVLTKVMFGRHYCKNWHEVQKMYQVLFKEEHYEQV